MIFEQQKVKDQLVLLSRIFNVAHDGIFVTDAQNIIVDVNPAFCRITGYIRDEVVGQNLMSFNSDEHSLQLYTSMRRSIRHHGYWHGELLNRKKDGELFTALLTISLLKKDDVIQNYIGFFTDITKSKHQQHSLELMTHYDVLTQLPNRILLMDRFKQAVAHSNRTNSLLAVCFLDLDNFKPINDNYGHNIGDQLLIEVATRIKAHIRDEDTLSRIGGDEFVLLLGDIKNRAECEQLLQRLHEAFIRPYHIDDLAIRVSASSGITFYPVDNADLDTLMRHADQAMYQAKLAGKNRYQIFNTRQDKQIIDKQYRMQEIRAALQKKQMCLYFQPKVNMKTGRVFGVEALIRWFHPEKGFIPPLDFLPLLEYSELEIQLGNWVIETALQQIREWQSHNINLEVSVNISSHHLQSSSFLADLGAALYQYPDIDPKFLQLEILESSALSDLETICSTIKTCRNTLGIHIALDDFGTGYSSLAHLRNIDANILKIDQTFVRDVLDDPNDYAIIDGVIGLAESFGREVIAEGVETTEHGLILILMGCEQAQGYGIAHPMPAADIPQWLNQYSANEQWITWSHKKLSTLERQLAILELTINHWFTTFKNAILAAPDSNIRFPIMDPTKCHTNFWIKRLHLNDTLEQYYLNKLKDAHHKMHRAADKIITTCQSNTIEQTRQQLEILEQSSYLTLINELKNTTLKVNCL